MVNPEVDIFVFRAPFPKAPMSGDVQPARKYT
jgi:hypothetical protein